LQKILLRGLAASVLLFAVLFALKLTIGTGKSGGYISYQSDSFGGFELARKNYASKDGKSASAPALSNAQKFEKIATLRETTNEFEVARKKIEALIAENNALIQFEHTEGLSGSRSLQLGIGVPPAKFDDFVEKISAFGKLTHLTIVKNDKTNEYRQLNAKRQSLEKSKETLLKLATSGGSVDERLKVQERLTEVEDKIQNLGVALGEFDTENEFCTVKLVLAEATKILGISWERRAFDAGVWTVTTFFMIAGGFFMLCVGGWLAALAIGLAARLMKVAQG
jgi:uncharacterized protein YfcZ (UPF0381/DUF406 family)